MRVVMKRLAIVNGKSAHTNCGDAEGQNNYLVPGQTSGLRPGLRRRLQSQDACMRGEWSARCPSRNEGQKGPTIGKCSNGQALEDRVEEE